MIIFNPVIISVVVMVILCLLNLQVILAILVSALVAGVMAGMPFGETMVTLINGMGKNSETALSYLLLGALAMAINHTGLATILAKKISTIVGGKKKMFLLLIALISCFSQNLIPVHIAFIPILIPPLLAFMNEMKMDRRAVACSLTFGLKTPYIVLPVGFGLIFHKVILREVTSNGLDVSLDMIWKSLWILGIGMFLGLIVAVFFSYRKDRKYEETEFEKESELNIKFNLKHTFALIAAVIAFGVQIFTGSLPLGAISALIFMFITKTICWKELSDVMNEGLGVMGFIAFVMLVAAGYGDVLRSTNSIEPLVNGIVGAVHGSQMVGAILMLVVGLFITMGIGTSFGTIPILATIYVPLGLSLGFTPMGIIVLIGAAGALGDAGSPASDSTLGPTSGLNADGQHNHIWDTCVPTFLHYNIPLIIFGVIGAMVL